MKARPILFSAPMIQALLSGKKTQTRRIVNNPDDGVSTCLEINDKWPLYCIDKLGHWNLRPCPYGKPGDLLWVRETFNQDWTPGTTYYRADGGSTKALGYAGEPKWKPSIFMPKAASRITLQLKSVGVELLQDISEADAKAEGCERDTEPCDHKRRSCEDIGCLGPTYKSSYCELWAKLNGWDSWKANPWVWKLEFDVYKKNYQSLLRGVQHNADPARK